MLKLNNSNKPTLHVDPFKKDKLESVHLRYTKFWSKDPFKWTGEIKFKNGNTSGQQEFEEKELPDILAKMQQFLDSL